MKSLMHEEFHAAEFRFYEELNDLLPVELRKRSFEYRFRGNPAIKDAIEAIGVPHTEVDLILVNGQSVGFDYPLQAGDRVSVYPVFESLDIGPLIRLRPRPLREPKFVCDVHLGKLARRLRLLGFDVIYRNAAADRELVDTALAERRIILTQDRGILKQRRVTHGYLVRSSDPHEQVVEVLRRFDLASHIDAFTRCTRCNGRIVRVDKASVETTLPPKVRENFKEFFQCTTCGRTYWKGTHYMRMQAYVQRVKAVCEQTGVHRRFSSGPLPGSL